MIEINFKKWRLLKESIVENNGYDPFTNLHQKQGDIVYFGIHDISKYYNQNGNLPDIDLGQVSGKSGQIVNANPIEQTVTVATQKPPFSYGYHKIESDKNKQNRKVDQNGMILITLTVAHLQDISNIVIGSQGKRIWLVVDSNTKYQQNIIKEIRKKEIEKSHMQQPAIQQQQPAIQQPQNNINQFQQQQNNINQFQQPQPQTPNFKMIGREVVPMQAMQNSHYDPTILSNDRYWKMHSDCQYYSYVKS